MSFIKEYTNCRRCGLHRTRTSVVFGRGRGRLVLIGEAPGVREDREGKPFVGPSGEMLESLLRSAGIPEEDIYITNIVACRPTDREGRNRTPTEGEITACSERLWEELAAVDPLVLVLLGSTPVRTLTGSTAAMGKLVGKLLPATIRYRGIEGKLPAFVSWHPAYLLRTDPTKRQTGVFGRCVRTLKAAKALYDALLQRERREDQKPVCNSLYYIYPKACLVSLLKPDFPEASLLYPKSELVAALTSGELAHSSEEQMLRVEVRSSLSKDPILRLRMPDECNSCYLSYQQECYDFQALYHWLIAKGVVQEFV